MCIFLIISLILVLIKQDTALPTKEGFNSKNLGSLIFKGIPFVFPKLDSDERLEIFHYEQSLAVRVVNVSNTLVHCEVVEVCHENAAREVCHNLTMLLGTEVKKVTMKRLAEITDECDELNGKTGVIYIDSSENNNDFKNNTDRNDTSSFKSELWNGIVPGTKWCGFGTVASKYHDLGENRDIDRCCRSHDLCPIRVRSKDRRYNLENDSMCTVSHCECDEKFYNCLKKIDDWRATILGFFYFTVTSLQCVTGLPEHPHEKMQLVPTRKKW